MRTYTIFFTNLYIRAYLYERILYHNTMITTSYTLCLMYFLTNINNTHLSAKTKTNLSALIFFRFDFLVLSNSFSLTQFRPTIDKKSLSSLPYHKKCNWLEFDVADGSPTFFSSAVQPIKIESKSRQVLGFRGN